MQKDIKKISNGVKINFTRNIKKDDIVTIVQNCSQGKCECMSETTKSKIKDMQVDGSDGDVVLKLEGDISVGEIQEAISRSKVIN